MPFYPLVQDSSWSANTLKEGKTPPIFTGAQHKVKCHEVLPPKISWWLLERNEKPGVNLCYNLPRVARECLLKIFRLTRGLHCSTATFLLHTQRQREVSKNEVAERSNPNNSHNLLGNCVMSMKTGTKTSETDQPWLVAVGHQPQSKYFLLRAQET